MSDSRQLIEKKSPKLIHFQGFNEAEVQEWLDKYRAKYGNDKTILDLDHMLQECKKTKWYYQVKIVLALSTNIPYFSFQMATFKDGIKGLINIISPGANIPDFISIPIGSTISSAELLLYLLMFSVKKEAELATLNYVLRDPLTKRIRNHYDEFKAHPALTLKEFIKFSLIYLMMSINNTNGTMTELIDLPEMEFLPPPVRMSLMCAIFYFGFYYHELYLNKMCLQGIKKWHEEKHAYLWERLLRGQFSTSFRVFVEGVLSTIVVRTWPFNVSVALKAWEVFGLYIPVPIVALAILFHTYYTFYPGTYEHYFSSLEKLEEIIERTITEAELNKKIENNYFVNKLNPGMLAAAKEVERYSLIDEKHQKLVTEYVANHGKLIMLKKEPYQMLPVGYCGIVGGFIGWQLASFLVTPWYLKLPFALLNAAGFFALFGNAEHKRVVDNEILKQLEHQQLEIPNADVNKNKDVISTSISLIICFLASLSNFSSNIGTAERLNSNQNSGMKVNIPLFYTAIPCLLNSINGLIFNLKMLPGTVKEYKNSFWNSAMSFWHKPKEAVVVEEVINDKKSLLSPV